MHSPPALRVSVVHFGVWRAMCAGFGAAALITSLLWAASIDMAAWVWAWPVAVAAGCAALMRPPAPFILRWDTQAWHLQPASGLSATSVSGALQVTLDLGGWMLLRLAPAGGGGARWLPVQRLGHESAWHGLRSTVYCARSPGDRAVADL